MNERGRGETFCGGPSESGNEISIILARTLRRKEREEVDKAKPAFTRSKKNREKTKK